MHTKLLIASNNAGKVTEIQALLQKLEVEILTPASLGLSLEVEEKGSTYAENARLKAVAFARASGILSLADDSGLEVDALNGAPGIRSARYAPFPAATDADRRRYLLENLRQHPHPWTARFRCVVALATPQGEVYLREGTCEGEIIPQERGTGGFGYDPIFRVAGTEATMAELTLVEKNQISHRARAVKAALPLLRRLLG